MVKRVLKELKKDTPIILAIVGSIGVVSTAIFAVKATPKALQLIEQRKQNENKDELSVSEIIETTWTCYIPSIITCAATISCIMGSYILNKRRQAILLNSYILLEQQYKEYKNSVKELYGEDADKKVKIHKAQRKYNEEEHASNKQLFFLEPYGEYFESTMEDVLKAEYELNRKFATEREASLKDLLDFLGISEVYDYESDGYKGWCQEIICDFINPAWIEFDHTFITLDDGMECCLISSPIEPRIISDDYPPF